MLQPVHDVAHSVLLRQIEQVDGARGVGDVDGQVDDLTQAVGSFVQAEQLRDGGGRVGTEFAW